MSQFLVAGVFILLPLSAIAGGPEPLEYSEDGAYTTVQKNMDTVVQAQTRLGQIQDKGGSVAEQQALTAKIEAQKAGVEAAAGRFKDSAKVQTSAANFWVMAGDNEKALTHAAAAVKAAEKHMTNPRNLADALEARALASAAAGDTSRAVADANEILKMYPDDDGALLITQMADRSGRNIRGTLALNGKRVKPPDTVQGRSTGVAPGQPDDRRSTGAGASHAGGETVGIEDRVGVISWPRVAASIAMYKKAMEASRQNDLPAVHAYAAQAITLFPQHVSAAGAAAVASAMMYHNQDALAEVAAALALKPGEPQFLAIRAQVYNQMSRHDEALKDAVKAISINPKTAAAWVQKGLARKGLGEAPDAYLEDIKRAVAEAPEFEPILRDEMQAALAARSGSSRATAASPRGGLLAPFRELRRRFDSLPKEQADGLMNLAWSFVGGVWVVAIGALWFARRRRGDDD